MHSLNSWPFFPASLEPKAASSFSLQFLLQEIFLAFGFFDELHTQISSSFEFPMSLEEIMKKLENYFLSPQESPPFLKSGFLEKLSFYVETLIQSSPIDQETAVLTHVEEIKKWLMHSKSKIKLLKKSENQQEKIQQALVSLFEDFKNHLRHLFDSLFPFFDELQEDENLLFLLIEQKEKMNQYLGNQALEVLLSRLFPQGPAAFRAALYNGYAKRGFLEFYARNEELIAAIDWDPCFLSDQKL
jgi:hypothetical protein